VRQDRLGWLWVLLTGMLLVFMISYAAHAYLPQESYKRTWFSGAELALGIVAVVIGHVWAFFRVLPERDDHDIFHYVDFSRLWRYTFQLLPMTRRPLWLGCWGGVAILCAIFLVGGIQYMWRGLPQRMKARPDTAAGLGSDEYTPARDTASAEMELASKDQDADRAEQEKRFSLRATIVGWFEEKDGTITGLVVALPGPDGLRFAGVVQNRKPATPEEQIQDQKALGKLRGLHAPRPPIAGLADQVKAGLGTDVLWARPEMSCEIDYAALGADGVFDDPVLKGW
jgi:hypothetical protein